MSSAVYRLVPGLASIPTSLGERELEMPRKSERKSNGPFIGKNLVKAKAIFCQKIFSNRRNS